MTSWLLLAFILFLATQLLVPAGSQAADKVRFATSFKSAPTYIIVSSALVKKGAWKANGIDGEIISFRGSGVMYKALTAGSFDMGTANTIGTVQAAFRGVPVKIVSDYNAGSYLAIYVRADSPIKSTGDLAGKKLGTSKAGGATHAYGRFFLKELGLVGKTKIVAIASFRARMAAIKSGAIDASIHSTLGTADLVAKKVLRLLVSVGDYLPKAWSFHVVFARENFLKENSPVVRRGVKAVKDAIEAARNDRTWVKEELKAVRGFSEEAAREVAQTIFPKPATGVREEGLKVIRDFMLEYGLLKKEQAIPLKNIYVAEFAQ
jgi:ABC-type nitrate/sulfonate/bicarbonate transport system substrate-binding protein